MTLSVIVGVVVGIIAYVFLFNVFFPNKGDFKDVVYYYFKPDLLSLIDGEYSKDVMAELKLGLWIFSGTLIGIAATAIVFQFIG